MYIPRARLLLGLSLSLSACAPDKPPNRADAGSDPSSLDASSPDGSDDGEPHDRPADAGDVEDAESDDPTERDLWQGCPSSEDYVGPGAGVHAIVATKAAVYCAQSDELRTLKQELAAKAKLRILPRSYFLRAQASAAYALPLCIRTKTAPHPELKGEGSLAHSQTPYLGGVNHSYTWTQPVMQGATSLQFLARFNVYSLPNRTPTLTLDGKHVALETVDHGGSFEMTLCEASPPCYPALRFDSCDFADSTRHVHEVTFEQGNIRIELNIGASFASTEPAAFARASGRFRGITFDQRDYWKLVYSPTHHHASRHFAVFFPSPIEGVCGLEFDHLEPWGDIDPDEAYAVDCKLDRLAKIAVQKHSHTVLEAP